jgi:outer membrane protein OmpA-like peptidoglycan-associated protein
MHLIPQSWPHLHILISGVPAIGLLCILGFYFAGIVKDDHGTQRTSLVLLILLGLLALPVYQSGAALTGTGPFTADAIGPHFAWGVAAAVALGLTGVAAVIALPLSPDKGGGEALTVVLGLAAVTLVILVLAGGWTIGHGELQAAPTGWPYVHVVVNHAPTVGLVFALIFFVVALLIGNDLMTQGSLILFSICAILGIPAYVSGAAGTPAPGISAAVGAHRDFALWTVIGLAFTGGASWLELWRSRYTFGRFSGLSLALVLVFAVITLGVIAQTGYLGALIDHPEIRTADALPATADTGITAAVEAFARSNTWFVPWQIVHFFGYCLIFGAASALLLRAFGYWKDVSFAAVHRLLVLGFIGVLINVVSGTLLMLHDDVAANDYAFAPKLAFITIGAIGALYFSASGMLWKLRPGDDAPASAKWVAAIVLLAWAGAIVSGLQGSPAVLAIHALATALVVGLVVIVLLRLLGLFDSIAYTSLKRLFPVLFAGFVIQLLSGAALLAPRATQYAVDVAFLLKVALVIAGIVLTWVLYQAVAQKAISWAAGTAPPPGRLGFVVPSLLVWVVAVILSWLTVALEAAPPSRAVQAPQPPALPPVAVNVPPAPPLVVTPPAPPTPVVVAPPAPPTPVVVTPPAPPTPVVADPPAPPPVVAAPPAPQRLDQIKGERKEVREGDRTVIQEANRTMIREGGHLIIRHDPVDRFRLTAKEVSVEQRGNLTVTVALEADGVQIVTEVDETGRLLRRIRRDATGNEMILIDNSAAPRGTGIAGLVVQLPPPAVTIAPEIYVREAAGATAEDISATLTAPPVEPIERRYTLDEILYSEPVRARMPRVDVNTVNFPSGSWEITPDQADRLALVAQVVLSAVKSNPGEVFLVEGYTDAVGNDVDNLSLSDRRAESVAVMLTSQFGVPPENLATQGYGKQFLKVQTDGPERANRRVAIRRITPLLNGAQN